MTPLTPREDVAILLYLRGAILFMKARWYLAQKQSNTGKHLMIESKANYEVAMEWWDFEPFQGSVTGQLSVVYRLQGKRDLAVRFFDQARQIAAKLGNDEDRLRKKGYDLDKMRELLGK